MGMTLTKLVGLIQQFSNSTNASTITTGTLADARLSNNVPLKDGNNAFIGSNKMKALEGTDVAAPSTLATSECATKVCTFTTTAAHGLRVNSVIRITSSSHSSNFNRDYVVFSVPSSTSFTAYANIGNISSAADTGTVTEYKSLVIGDDLDHWANGVDATAAMNVSASRGSGTTGINIVDNSDNGSNCKAIRTSSPDTQTAAFYIDRGNTNALTFIASSSLAAGDGQGIHWGNAEMAMRSTYVNGWCAAAAVAPTSTKDTTFRRFAAGVVAFGTSNTSVSHLVGGGASVASAAALPLPTGNVFHVTGTTNVTSITATNLASGVEIILIFDGVLTFTHGNNIILQGATNFTTGANDTLKLVYDGTNFYEVSRSVNH